MYFDPAVDPKEARTLKKQIKQAEPKSDLNTLVVSQPA